MAIRAITNDLQMSVIRSSDLLENMFVQDCAKLGYTVHEKLNQGKTSLATRPMEGEEAYALKTLLEEEGHSVGLSQLIFNGQKWVVALYK